MNKQKKIRLFLLAAICLFALNTCNKAFMDSGPMVTKEIALPKKINLYEVKSIFDIVLVQDTINKVLVTCGENLQPYVKILEKNDTILLSHNTKQNWSRDYERIKLELHISENFYMNIWEAVNIRSNGTIKLPSFIILDWGIFSDIDINLDVDFCLLVNSPEHFGLIKARGKSNHTELWNRGSSKFYTDSLISNSCRARQGGWGDMYINATNNLTVSLESTGDVYYSGNPQAIKIENQKGGNLLKYDN